MDASSSNPNMHQQVNWVCPREHMQREHYKLLLAGKENLFAIVKNRLSRSYHVDPKATLEKTAFGVYMRYPNVITKSNKCIHYLISREVIAKAGPDPDPTAIFFRVENKIVRFGRLEFALVTGLRFGRCKNFDPFGPNILQPNSVYTRLFRNTPITVSSLWYWYQDDIHFTRLDLEDCLKVTQILIAALIVLGLESNSRIPDFMWVLVENQKAWDKFPWGSVSFQILLKALKGVKYNITSKAYHLNGNTLAFMGWIYEAFPDLGKSIGGRFPKNFRPRGLRYSYDKSDAYEPIEINEVCTSLEADYKELKKSYIITLEPLGTPFRFQYDRRSTRGLARPDGDDRSVAVQEVDAEGGEAEGRRRGKRRRDPLEEIVVREMKKTKKEMTEMMKKEILGTFAEHVAGLVFEKIKMFVGHGNAGGSGSGHGNVGGSEASGEGSEKDSDVEGSEEGEEKDSEEKENSDEDEAGSEEGDEDMEQEMEEQTEEEIEKEMEEEMQEVQDRERANNLETEDDVDVEKDATTDGKPMGLSSRDEFDTLEQLEIFELTSHWCQVDEAIATTTAPTEEEQPEVEQPQVEQPEEEQPEVETNVATPSHSIIPDHGIESTEEHRKAEADAEVHADAEASTVKPVFIYRRAQRKKKPAPALKSPFLPNDVRGTDFQKFMRGSTDATRNVGLPFAVDKSYFELIKNPAEKLENVHLDVFVSILATVPDLVGIHKVSPRTKIVGSSFMLAIKEAWNMIKQPGRFTDEENVPEEELKNLSRFVDGLIPDWGAMQSWHDADRVIMVCNFNQHWATCELDLVNCKLELWDSKQHIFEDIHYEIRTTAFTPVARIVPQVLKYMRFYDNRPGVKPTYSQWPLSFPVQNVIKQSDSESCGPIALKYAVCLLQGVAVKKMTKKDVQEWRNHIAECIYNFSTDGSTIEF